MRILFAVLIAMIIVWVPAGMLTSAGILAQLRNDFPENYKDAKWARERCTSIRRFIVFGPIGFLAGALVTDFYKDGFTLTCEPLQ